MKILKIICVDLGWDNVMCLADSWESAAFNLEYETVEDLKDAAEENDWIMEWTTIVTLPEDSKTLEEAIEKHWDC